MLCPALAAPASADSPMPENKVPGWVESTARRLANGLKQQGYEVARGYFKLYTQDDCPYSYEVLHSCLGNNPAAPYVLPIVPAWPDEWVDPGDRRHGRTHGGGLQRFLPPRPARGDRDPRPSFPRRLAISACRPICSRARASGMRTAISTMFVRGQHPRLAQYVLHQAAQERRAPAALRGPERPHQQCGDRERVERRLGPGALLRHHAGQEHGPCGPASPRQAGHPGQAMSSPSRSLPSSEIRIWRSGSTRGRMIS